MQTHMRAHRERQRKRDTKTETERQTERDRQREIDRQTESVGGSVWGREGQTDRQKTQGTHTRTPVSRSIQCSKPKRLVSRADIDDGIEEVSERDRE